jgi:hypothetical protein
LNPRNKDSIVDHRVKSARGPELYLVFHGAIFKESDSLRLQCEKLAIDAEVEELLPPQGGFLGPERIISHHESRAADVRLFYPATGDGCDRTLDGRRTRSLGIVKCGSRECK